MGAAVKLQKVGGKFVSAKSKTGNPQCSQAMSAWVRARHAGQSVAAEIFKILGKCRSQARQNKKAGQLQQAGKLAEGRGTWQRSERAAGLAAQRKALAAARAPKFPGPAQGQQTLSAAAKPAAARAPKSRDLDARAARVRAKILDGLQRDGADWHTARAKVNALLAKPTTGMTLAEINAHKAATREAAQAASMLRRDNPKIGVWDRRLDSFDKRRSNAIVDRSSRKATTTRKPAAQAKPAPAPAADNGFRPGASMQGPYVKGRKELRERTPGLAMAPAEKLDRMITRRLKKGTREDRLAVLVNRFGGLARREDAAGRIVGRDIQQTRRDKLRALMEKDKPAPAAGGGFALRAGGGPKQFASTGKGSTGVLFGDMKGAAAKDLPGQTNFTDRPDHLVKAAGDRADWRAVLESSRKRGGDVRQKKAAKLKAQRAELARLRRDPSSHTDHAPGTITHLSTELIHFDPKRFQYKLAHAGDTGSVGSLAGVQKYDPELGGVLQVWKDPANGRVYVVNGHNRLDLAKRLGAGKVAVRFLGSKSAEDARAVGALTNIAEGRGTSLDAAKFFKDTGHTSDEIKAKGIPMRERIATEGLALSQLHPRAFDRVVSGELPTARAAIIGGSGLTHEQQTDILSKLDKLPRGKQPTDSTVRNWIEDSKAAPTATKKTASLFGDDEETVSLGLHRGALVSHVQDRLGREKKLFGTVARSRNANELERGGNQINAEESGKISAAAAENLGTFNAVRNLRGEVSDLLNEGALRIHNGEKPREVYADIYRRLPAAVQAVYGGGTK
ncbi:MAG: hypothetical protein BGO49_27205 [Planctomycetales bacterium 71-10]|nr:MAG: hypothetical protein BGO49_27205 [Planctomycetales bacterium 71-10]